MTVVFRVIIVHEWERLDGISNVAVPPVDGDALRPSIHPRSGDNVFFVSRDQAFRGAARMLPFGPSEHRFEILDRKVRSAFLVGPNVGLPGGQVEPPVERPIRRPLVVFLWDSDRALLADRLPLPAQGRKALDLGLVFDEHRGLRAGPRHCLDDDLQPLSIALRVGGGELSARTHPPVLHLLQCAANSVFVDVDVEFSVEMLRDAWGRPSSCVLALPHRISSVGAPPRSCSISSLASFPSSRGRPCRSRL